jgi:chromate reductase
MSHPLDIAVLIGSLRHGSISRKLAEILKALAPPELHLSFVEIGDLPLYNQDFDNEKPPEAWTKFRERIQTSHGVLFVTPEYNRSIPAVLKNALDVGSRPFGRSVWNGKPGAIIGSSPGTMGGFGAVQHLRQCMVSLNVPVLQQPEVYISNVDKVFVDENGVNDSLRHFLTEFLLQYHKWIEKIFGVENVFSKT